jgi:hypothetical protein
MKSAMPNLVSRLIDLALKIMALMTLVSAIVPLLRNPLVMRPGVRQRIAS